MPRINLGKAYQKFPMHGTMMSHIVLFAPVFPKLDSLSAMKMASTEDEDDIPLEELTKMRIQLREKEEITDDVLIDDFLSLDSEAETLTKLDILNSVKNKNNTAMNCDEDGNDSDAEINTPSYNEILKSFETFRSGLQFEENTPQGIFGALQRCETYYERKHFLKQKSRTKLIDFISN
ncbi:hypothetical protein AVEN_13104-1 [Araneus ventricosus]|uniref:Uncharacterized protein n=1 Tax=Araneus ventricosus TaxID=182803 RepID=A0A4Y2KA29_ARAVE|nr:hypothetical protein AVEN_13104-1 [Araneus ventricosus]